jgi:uncharacterized protein (TIGR02118 family)
MIRLTVLYPNLKGSRFDFDYYVNVHTPLAKRRFGDCVVSWEIDRGIEGENSGDLPAYQVAAFITFTSLEEFRKVMAEHGAELRGDFIKYTDVYPRFLISNVEVQ